MNDNVHPSVKLAVLWVVALFEKVQALLPSIILWGTAIYTVLQVAWMFKKFWDKFKGDD
ncbi:hypothetical protein [Nitrosovibrio sp. Nv4]|uniref:hypothetical protein n=1 Tax=Nitrosovibrio sp. Nv4 TaxID=1945880 RepID=UPI000BC37BB5|nr:hypothetical protein [Nitrosovibrio sp. Nv4]SOD41308.1 hypothetical protein SAMN06298226_1603 [Nitrosovibrio sp. Nv4]